MNERLLSKGKSILLIVTTLILLILYSGNETYAITEYSIAIIPEDSLIAVTSGTAIIPTGNYIINENNMRFQLSEGYSGTITISKDVNKVTIAGYVNNVIHDDTNITLEEGREQAIELTIEDLYIRAPFYKNGIDFSNAGEFNNRLYISGLNNVSGINEYAAIHIPDGTQLTINKVEGLIEDEALLIATGSSGAGIGGNSGEDGGHITVEGGKVSVNSYSGAGIGGGDSGDGGVITISGGTVTTTSSGGAGIGSGDSGDGGVITISGGIVTTTSSGGAGIGSGSSSDGGIITISGGIVNATGSTGIGSETSGSVDTITISGGTVTAIATGGSSGAGIGSGGWGGSFNTINISGGKVNAKGDNGPGIGRGNADSAESVGDIIISGEADITASSNFGAGIGSGYSGGAIANITIRGGTVTATGGSDGAGIGGGANGSGGEITIRGGTVTATGNYYGAGIGGGYRGNVGTINIINGTVTATGGDRGAGIGTGYEGTGVTIIIDGGTIEAKGSTNFGAAIGGGDKSLKGMITINGGIISAVGYSGAGIGFNGNGSTININGGDVTANGGSGSAGISSGVSLHTSDTLTINGGIIETTGGHYGAGIGGAVFQRGGTITINGGEVTATGGEAAAGIGGGYYGAGGTIAINGGKVTATGGDKAAGIGGGNYGAGGSVTVTGTPIIIASGDTEEYAENIGYGYGTADSGSLKDDSDNDLTYMLFSTSGLPGVNIKVEMDKDYNWVTATDGSYQTNNQGLCGIFIQRSYYSGRYTLSKTGYAAVMDWYYGTYPYLIRKNINFKTEMIPDNTPPIVTDLYIENDKLFVFMDDCGIMGTMYLIPKTDTVYFNKGNLDELEEAIAIDLFWTNEALIELSELRKGYYQVYVADSAENLSIPYEVNYKNPKSSSTQEYAEITTGDSETSKILSKFNSATKNVETDISGIPLRKISESMTVSIPKIKGALSYTLSFTKDLLSSATGDTQIVMETELGTIVVPKNMIDNMQTDDTDKVSLTIQAAYNSDLPVELQEQLKNKPIIKLSLTVDGKQIAWNNADAPVSVSIPYIPDSEELSDLEHIVVWYIDGGGNVISVPNGRYDKDTGYVTFTTTHFSQYAVAFAIKTFDDIGSIEWAKKYIEVLASKGILIGVTEREYAPQKSITRADFLYYLIKTLSVGALVNENFDDIESEAYYYKEIGIARKLGITYGTGNNKFSPDVCITRQDMMVLTENALRVAKNMKNQAAISELEKYTDRFLVSDYAVSSVAYMLNDGLIVGSGDKINPLGNTTRAEAAVLLYRIYKKY